MHRNGRQTGIYFVYACDAKPGGLLRFAESPSVCQYSRGRSRAWICDANSGVKSSEVASLARWPTDARSLSACCQPVSMIQDLCFVNCSSSIGRFLSREVGGGAKWVLVGMAWAGSAKGNLFSLYFMVFLMKNCRPLILLNVETVNWFELNWTLFQAYKQAVLKHKNAVHSAHGLKNYRLKAIVVLSMARVN